MILLKKFTSKVAASPASFSGCSSFSDARNTIATAATRGLFTTHRFKNWPKRVTVCQLTPHARNHYGYQSSRRVFSTASKDQES